MNDTLNEIKGIIYGLSLFSYDMREDQGDFLLMLINQLENKVEELVNCDD